jgi:hypothetical protein
MLDDTLSHGGTSIHQVALDAPRKHGMVNKHIRHDLGLPGGEKSFAAGADREFEDFIRA